jgi:6,7-dimethyl-8-ribityllumazine synthase
MSNQPPQLTIDKEAVKGKSILIVRSLWHSEITELMLSNARETLHKYECKFRLIEVSGTYEIPFAIQEAFGIAKRQGVDIRDIFQGIIALGCVIKGETDHHFYIAQSVANQLQRLMFHLEVPISFGIITAFNEEQAKQRVQKGREAAEALLHLWSSLSSYAKSL